jgi:hypothetical protein
MFCQSFLLSEDCVLQSISVINRPIVCVGLLVMLFACLGQCKSDDENELDAWTVQQLVHSISPKIDYVPSSSAYEVNAPIQDLQPTLKFVGIGTFAIIRGALPPGVSLDGQTGLISGIPTAAGIFSDITVRVTDERNFSGDFEAFRFEVVSSAASITCNVPGTTAGGCLPATPFGCNNSPACYAARDGCLSDPECSHQL